MAGEVDKREGRSTITVRARTGSTLQACGTSPGIRLGSPMLG